MMWVFPKNRGIPKWMVYNGKLLLKWMIWGYHYFWKHPYVHGIHLSLQFSVSTGVKSHFSKRWWHGETFYFLADPIDGPIFRWQVDFTPTGLQPWWGWYFVGSRQPATSKKFMVFSRCFCWKSPRKVDKFPTFLGLLQDFGGLPSPTDQTFESEFVCIHWFPPIFIRYRLYHY